MSRWRLLDLNPAPRHAEGLSAGYDVLISVVTAVAGGVLLLRGQLWGIVFVLACLYCARSAYLKYLAGNWP